MSTRISLKDLSRTYGHRFCDRCGEWFQRNGKSQRICEACVLKKRREAVEERWNQKKP